jgi:hypothetical protein
VIRIACAVSSRKPEPSLLVERQGRDGMVEIWRVELPNAKSTLLRVITPPGDPAMNNGFNMTASRDGKSYAYRYHPINSTEYLVRGLR